MKKIYQLGFAVFALIMLVCAGVVGKVTGDRDAGITENIYRVNENSKAYSEESNEVKKAAMAKSDALKAQLGGIVCWGDYNTVGVEGYAYSSKINEIIGSNGLELPVENMGIAGEDSLSVLGRQGGVPLVVDGFEVMKSAELQPIKVTSKNGEAVNVLCKTNNPGLNPVSIGGVQGLIGGVADEEDKNKTASFYFRREKAGSSFNIAAGTVVQTHVDKDYNKYINVFWVGDNGGWDNQPQKLVEQLTQATGVIKDGRFVVIGLSEGDSTSNAEVDRLMKEKFGNKFINPREVVIAAVKASGEELSESELNAVNKGQIPKAALNVNGRIDRAGLEAIGSKVYEVIEQNHYLNVNNG